MSHSVALSSLPARDGRRPTILFVNDLWGYGTVTMAMAVAEELQGRAICRFAGKGPGFDLARRGCFDDLVLVDTTADPISRALDAAIETADAVVDVMNDVVAHRAANLGVPCIYLDCLAWMWAQPPALPPGVPYLAESFPGVEAQLTRWRQPLPLGQMVGPMVVRPRRPRSELARTALINFGGLTCSLVDQPTLVAYATTMARCSLEALGGATHRAIVAAGRHILELIDQDVLRAVAPDVELADLSHETYIAELARSHVLISSSGMHALYEASAHGVPCVCLPPQNLSGSLALDELERTGVERPLNWSHLYGLTGLTGLTSEADACRRIGDQIHRFSADEAARRRLVENLRDRLQPGRLQDVQRRQAEFLAAQGDLGAPVVANRVLELLDAAAPITTT